MGNQGYCIVKDIDGTTVMADARNEKEEISFSSKDVSGCEVVWSYEVEAARQRRLRNLWHTIPLISMGFNSCFAWWKITGILLHRL